VQILRLLVVVATLLAGCLEVAAQDAQKQFRFPRNVGDVVRYESMADIPDTLLSALRRVHCQVDDGHLKRLPIVAFRPMSYAGGYATLATCDNFVANSYVFWQRHPRSDPEHMWFAMPNIVGEPGFGVTRSPGFLEWDTETKTLNAIQSTDICPRVVGRTTYRLVPGVGREGDSMPSWMLTKVETTYEPLCERVNEWKLVWEAKPWPDDALKPTP
jgi:hypothetical protein